MKVPVVTKVLKANDRIAAENNVIFTEKGLLAINMMSGPGAGKTSLIERTIRSLKDELTIAVIEGDIQTTYDADRISATGANVVQINTEGACHLDANTINHTISQMDLDSTHVLIIENVGNLVCPASFDLGTHHKVVLLSTTEGDDKPLKYPMMFDISDALLINKIDLLPYVECDIEKIRTGALKINPKLDIFEVSCKTGEGLEGWFDWLKSKVKERSES
jgi:hydrogenase nickel incorporation protein HypB